MSRRTKLVLTCDRCGEEGHFTAPGAGLPDAAMPRSTGWHDVTLRGYGLARGHAEAQDLLLCHRCTDIARGDREAGIEMDTGPPHISIELEAVAGSDEPAAGPIQATGYTADGRLNLPSGDPAVDCSLIPRWAMLDVWLALGLEAEDFKELADNNTPHEVWSDIFSRVVLTRGRDL